jgi:lipopolysaccharide transport system permease protein
VSPSSENVLESFVQTALSEPSRIRKAVDGVVNFCYVGWRLFIQDLKYRYSMALLGWFWFFIGPILTVIPFIAMGKQFDMGAKGSNVRYEVYALVGAMLWQVFWSAVNLPQMILRRFKMYIKCVSIPPGLILMVCAFAILINSSVQLAILIGTVLVSMPLSMSFFMGMVSIPILMVCGFAIGIFIAPVGLMYRDFRYGMSYLSSFFLFTAPIYYAMPEKGFLRYVNMFNPVTYIVGVPRDWFVGNFQWTHFFFVVAVGVFVALLLFGLKFYQRALSVSLENM